VRECLKCILNKKMNFENIFLSAIGSNQRLKWFLHHNINLVQYLDSVHTKSMAIADLILLTIPKKVVKKEVDKITIETILNVLERNRQDLYKIINTPKGLGWLKEQVDNFRKRFL